MKRFAVIIVLLLALFGIADLFRPGFFSSHDGMGHVIRLDEFYRSLGDGHFPVRWSERLYFGYGYPFFNFNYPLVYYLGAPLMAIGLNAADAVKGEFILTYLLSGALMFFYLRRKVGLPFAVLGVILYLYAPYRLLNIYVRGSVAEAMAFVFPPFLLWGAELLAENKKGSILITATVFGFLGISHNISALLLAGFFFTYLSFLAVSKKSFWLLTKGALSFLWGIAMAAFFMLPALYEKKWTFLDLTLARDYPNYFISSRQLVESGWGFGAVTLNLGYVAMFLAVLALTKIRRNLLLVFCFLIIAVAIFFMLPVSRFLWDRVPLLPFVQFPWRFIMLTVPTLTVAGVIGLEQILEKFSAKAKFLAVIFLIAATLFLAKDQWRRNQTEPVPVFLGEAIPGSTTWAHEQATRWLVPKPEKIPANKIENVQYQIKNWKTIEHDYLVTADKNTLVTENTMYYPGWKVFVDGREQEINYDNGKINFAVSPGKHEVVSKFGETNFRKTADLISVAAVLGLFLGYVVLQIFPQHQPRL